MRHEPGKNLGNTGVSVVPGPQTQEFTVVPSGGCRQAVNVVAAVLHGANRMVPSAPVPIAREVTMIIPPRVTPGVDSVVVTVATYLVPEAATVCSQPHPLAAIAVPDAAD